MTRKEMKLSLKSAVLSATPDVLDKILSPTPQREASVKEFKEQPPVRKSSYSVLACMAAALVFLILGAVFLGQPKVESVISIDVNPGIELSIDNWDRVVEYRALNKDAEKVLSGMSLKYQDVDIVTSRVFESILKQGYLPAGKADNTVLISVASDDTVKAEALQSKICSSVKTVLASNHTEATVIQQQDTYSDELKDFASEQGISLGKADLIRKLSEKDSSIDPTKVSQLSLSQLSDIIVEKQIDVGDTVKEFVDEPKESSSSSSSGGSLSGSESAPAATSDSGKLSSSESSLKLPSSSSQSGNTSSLSGYCEYCGQPAGVCQGHCDRSVGKRYCPVCGKLLADCTCHGKKPSSSSSQTSSGNSSSSSSSSSPEYMDSGKRQSSSSASSSSAASSAASSSSSSSSTSSQTSSSSTSSQTSSSSSSSQAASSSTSSIEVPRHGYVYGKYCIYCGRLLSICRDRCDGTIPKYCARCGKPLDKCKCVLEDGTD